MGYSKLISYGDSVELYVYEENLRFNGRRKSKRTFPDISSVSDVVVAGKSDLVSEKPPRKRRDNARRASMAFRRLVYANLGESDVPLFVSVTYRQNIYDVGRAHKDFNAFVRNVRDYFGSKIRYLAVPEFQDVRRHGVVHFHALFWGLPVLELARTERRTRLFSGFWGQGFVDLVATDGSEKLAGYLSKYFSKSYLDQRLFGKKAFWCSRNIRRPVVDKNPMLLPYFSSLSGVPDLSTASVLTQKEYMTQWLGKGRYTLYKLNSKK